LVDDLPPVDRVTSGGVRVFAKGGERSGGGGNRNLVMNVSQVRKQVWPRASRFHDKRIPPSSHQV
jgi:hypothetical protein